MQDKVIIRVNPNNYKKLSNYYNIKVGDEIEIDISDLSKNSHVLVMCKCDVCGCEKSIQYKSYISNISKYNYYACSSKCALSKSEQTNLSKLGVKYPSQNINVYSKYRKTMLQKYGVDNSLKMDGVNELAIKGSKTKDSIDKRRKTNISNWGFDNVAKNNIIKEKIVKTNQNRYGVDYPSQKKDFVSKFKDSILSNIINKYADLEFIKKEGYLNYCNCSKCKDTFEIDTNLLYYRYNNDQEICTLCNDPYNNSSSNFERQIYNFICDNYDGERITNFKYKNKREIDIYLPDLKLAIECNGLFWHSDKFKDRNYHLNKMIELKKMDIDLIYIWEDDWETKREIVKSIILTKLNLVENKIFARKCQVKFIEDNKIVRNFLTKNHIQGYTNSKYKIGLIYNDELVSLMCFSKKRKDMELVRFCNKLNSIVVGSASRLLNFFLKNKDYNEIITYVDNSIFKGGTYEKIGFEFCHKTKPNYWWVVSKNRKHRFNYSKKKLSVLYPEKNNKSESEIMKEMGFYKIYGVGMTKYKILNIKK